ncbi:PAS domain-containing sensor histidine kinase [Paludisphaera borealis]|uniref:histidine kinase n=1 Tax=Paludisphaera borealis TaxID=1387353 RepID=A0A1U7CT93_9BACT|nr:PAS domain S-box protein [Paludisphaera borealis]APW62170.1 Sporulation kinase E [Paludisphaera borealis]
MAPTSSPHDPVSQTSADGRPVAMWNDPEWTTAKRDRLLHRLLETGPQPFATIDLADRIVHVNQAFSTLVGYTPDELLGMSIMDLTAPQSHEITRRSHEQTLATGKTERVVKRYRHKDGRLVPVELLLDVARDDEGRPIGLFAFITEISQRIQAEEALLDSERRARTIFDGIHDAVLVHDQKRSILDANPAASRLLGYTRAELVGMNTARIDAPDFAAGFEDRLKRQLEDGRLSCEGTFLTKDGRTIPVEITTSTIQFDEQLAILAVIRDITERKALERTRREFARVQMQSAQALEAKNRALSQSEERYRRLTEGSLDAIVVTDGQGRILLFNPAAETIFGHESKEVIGEPLDLLIPSIFEQKAPPSPAPAAAEPPRQDLPLDVSPILGKTVELTGRKRDGGGFPIEISFSAVEANGRVEYVASIRDQTERQRMRAMLAHTDKLASIGLLSAGVAHEINNPLSYVGNNLAVLQRDVKGLMEMLGEAETAFQAIGAVEPEKAARFNEIVEEIDWPYIRENLLPMIDRTLEGVRRVANIVQKMRGLARTSRPRWEAVPFAELLDSALEMMSGRLKRDGVEVVVENHGVQLIHCVPTDLSQVLLNLLINALQAVESNGRTEGGRIEVDVRPLGPWVQISVADNGAGIAPEDLGRLFDPFFTTKPVGEGTGLGLAISHGIITGHGGRIEVESRPGDGTRFRVLLPKDPAGRPSSG